VVICTDCIDSYKFNYHTITITAAPMAGERRGSWCYWTLPFHFGRDGGPDVIEHYHFISNIPYYFKCWKSGELICRLVSSSLSDFLVVESEMVMFNNIRTPVSPKVTCRGATALYCLYCQVIPKCSQWSKAKSNSGDNQWTCKTTTDQDTFCIMKCICLQGNNKSMVIFVLKRRKVVR
jgi:hypothetical protein